MTLFQSRIKFTEKMLLGSWIPQSYKLGYNRQGIKNQEVPSPDFFHRSTFAIIQIGLVVGFLLIMFGLSQNQRRYCGLSLWAVP
jgi:hypothetical protein